MSRYWFLCTGLLCRHKHVASCFHMYIYIKVFLFEALHFTHPRAKTGLPGIRVLLVLKAPVL